MTVRSMAIGARPANAAWPVLWAIAAGVVFQGAAALTKAIGAALPALETSFIRGAAGLLFLGGALYALRDVRRLRDPGIHLVRGVLGAVALFSLMYSYTALPLALVAVVLYARVLLMIPIARLFLGEAASPGLWAAAVIGFAGVVVALSPALRAPELNMGVPAILLAALASSGSQVAVRRLTETNPVSVIIAVYALVTTIVLAVPAAVVWKAPTAWEAAALLGVGLCGAGAQYCMGRAYAVGPVAVVSPVSYVEVLIAAAIGYAMAGEVPSLHLVAGAVLILGATAYITSRGQSVPRGTLWGNA